MSEFSKKISRIAWPYGLLTALGFSVSSHALETANRTVPPSIEPYYEDITAQLPAGAASTEAVAHTMVQFELYRAYRLAEQQHCQDGWVLMGSLVHKQGPHKLAWEENTAYEPGWVYNTRRKLMPWTCNVDPGIYLETVRGYLPGWISIRYLTAKEIRNTQALASLQ